MSETTYDDDDFTSNSIIRGTKLKFTNEAAWMTGSGEIIPPNREFIVWGDIKAIQKWIDGMPAEGSRVLEPGESWPDIEALNKQAPQEEWRDAFGKSVGPWEKCRALYLFCPQTCKPFTWPTSTKGGDRAIRDLKEAIRVARGTLYGPDAHAVVTLGNVFMPTDYGGRQRPDLKIQRFINGGPGGGGVLEAKPAAGLIEQKPAPQADNKKPRKKPRAKDDDLDDDLDDVGF
jgi:hypothetical protein